MSVEVKGKIKKRRTWGLFDVIIVFFLTVLALITVFPLYYVLIVSVSDPEAVANHVPYLLPHAFDLESYRVVFTEGKFIKSFFNSVFVTVVGTIINMALSVFGAYALSKKKLIGRNFFLTLIIFTMLFSGGMIPFYLVVSSLKLNNTLWAMILPCAINTFYLIIMKNYFMTIPESLEDAAKIDGANNAQVLFKIVLPISMPFIATFTLFYAVERWNEWWNALLFINKTDYQPLQIYMRELLINFNNQLSPQAQAVVGKGQKANFQAIQMATIVVSTFPILCVYPFVQKHFVKGMLVGSIKE